MSSQLLLMLFLTSLAQEKKEWRPIPAPPARGQAISIGVRIAGGTEIRQITFSMPALAEPNDDDDKPAPNPALLFNIQTAVVNPENVDRWVFGNDESDEARHKRLEDILEAKAEAATLKYKLTRSQRAKLRLAGRGDIKRFFDQVQTKRSDFEADRPNFRSALAALKRLEPLTHAYREGLFDDSSLFAKTLRKINDDQKAIR